MPSSSCDNFTRIVVAENVLENNFKKRVANQLSRAVGCLLALHNDYCFLGCPTLSVWGFGGFALWVRTGWWIGGSTVVFLCRSCVNLGLLPCCVYDCIVWFDCLFCVAVVGKVAEEGGVCIDAGHYQFFCLFVCLLCGAGLWIPGLVAGFRQGIVFCTM